MSGLAHCAVDGCSSIGGSGMSFFRCPLDELRWAQIGCITEISLMAKSILLFGRGCFLKFLDIITNEVDYHTLNNHEVNGDGIKCFVGHPIIQIFAYCENCNYPNIYVKSYPDFQIIAKFPGDHEGYKSLTFSESSLLFSLGEMPHNKVTAWNWRSVTKFTESSNEMKYENQIIRCSYGRPMFLAQLGVGSFKLFIWDVFTVCKRNIYDKHEVLMGDVTPSRFQDIVWSMEAVGLYIIDSNGCIYTVDRDFYLQLIVDTQGLTGDVTPSICWYQHGLTVSGPNREIRHYLKQGHEWICDYKFSTQDPILGVSSGKYEKCVGRTHISEIVAFGLTEDTFSYVKQSSSNFHKICILNPTTEFMIVHRSNHHLDLLKVETGESISSIFLEHEISSLVENPRYPYAAIGHNNGYISLVSFYNENEPSLVVSISIADFDLVTSRFFENGIIWATGNFDIGEFFILKGWPGTQIEVVVHVVVGRQVTDYMLVASQNMIRFFVIPVTQEQYHAGNQVLRYCIVDKRIVNVKTFKFENVCKYYKGIIAKKGQERERSFYLVPYHTRYIEAGETYRGSSLINVTEHIKTGHQIKQFEFGILPHYFVSLGYDGFIFVRSNDFQRLEAMALNHHRAEEGVKRAICNQSATVIISLGHDGVVAAVRSTVKLEDREFHQKLKKELTNVKVALMFKRPTLGFYVEERFKGKCWKEIQRLKSIEAEEELCRVEKTKLLKIYHEIQTCLKNLVTENLEGPDNRKIDLMEFYLDTATYNKKAMENKEKCKEMKIYLQSLILAQDKVSSYIINVYYLPMGVQWENIVGIFSDGKATNYCLLPTNMAMVHRRKRFEEQRKIEKYLTKYDTFEPWVTFTTEELQIMKDKRPVIPKDDYAALATSNLQSLEISELADVDTAITFAGTVSPLYIDISPGHYKQIQLNTFYQCVIQQAVAEGEVVKLKVNYNKCFSNTKAVKEREVYNIREKNLRLRHIVSEFNYFSDKKISLEFQDPVFDPIEIVETAILRVTDDEIPVRLYISPSEQVILDAKAAEEERLRLLLLADDFRERALMAMMNGVLEVRWEDELRKNVPMPKCMIEKVPEDYNGDDLLAIRDYEDKVDQLQIEREKYKSFLEVEFGKLSIALRDNIRKFNQKLYDCTKFKFYIDQGMNQENLTVNRQRVIQNSRIELDEKEVEIFNRIKEYEVAIEINQRSVNSIIEALEECKGHIENRQANEKNLERGYKKELINLAPVLQEQALKLYKRRPKVSFRSINTATVLIELAKGVITNEITCAMTQECLDYLKALDNLDSSMDFTANTSVDQNTWKLICNQRRLRIDNEIQLRAAQIQIMEGETTLQTFQKRVAAKKEKVALLNVELESARAARIYLIHNKQLQLVLRRGLVEIPLTGDLYMDFQDAILIPKTEIEAVNNLINEAGNLKLKIIEQNMTFRRRIMAVEWEHMNLRMKINDFLEQVMDIEKVVFTREMRDYLKNKSLGRTGEMESYEMEMELLTTMFEKKIEEKKDKLKKRRGQLMRSKHENRKLDGIIKNVNIDVCLYKLNKNDELHKRQDRIVNDRSEGMIEKHNLITHIQENHNKILILQAELEVLRLKTFPNFGYRVLDE